MAVQAFSEMVELFLSTENNDNNITDKEAVRQQLNTQLKRILMTESFIGKEDISRILLVNSFWIATLIDLPNDEEMQQALLAMLKAWSPGPEKRFIAEDYERQHMALALQNLAKLYKQNTLPLFYQTYYQEFVTKELAAEKVLEGSKIQFAQVYPSFMEHCFQASDEEQKMNSQPNELHKLIIDQYKVFFDVDQNKEVMHMAMDNCADLIVKM